VWADNQLIYVGRFYSLADAAKRLCRAIIPLMPDIMKVPKDKYSFFIITQENLDKLAGKKLLDSYIEYYQKTLLKNDRTTKFEESTPAGYKKIQLVYLEVVIGCFAFVVILICLQHLMYLVQLPSFRDLENPKSNQASEIISSDKQVLGTYYTKPVERTLKIYRPMLLTRW
jgi:hypothetical protein